MSAIRQQIRDNVISTLRAITTGGGYNYTLSTKKVGRERKNPSSINEFPYVAVVNGSEVKTYEDSSRVESYLEILVIGYEHSETDPGNKLDNLAQDFEKALAADHTRGGLAINTVPQSIDNDEGYFHPYGVVEARYRVHYQYFYGEP